MNKYTLNYIKEIHAPLLVNLTEKTAVWTNPIANSPQNVFSSENRYDVIVEGLSHTKIILLTFYE